MERVVRYPLLFVGEPNNCWRWRSINTELRINDEIRARDVRVINAKGEQLGIMTLRDALQAAAEKDLDLVEVAPLAKPPVCRIMDYGKYRYEQNRRDREARKKQHVVEVKEIQKIGRAHV